MSDTAHDSTLIGLVEGEIYRVERINDQITLVLIGHTNEHGKMVAAKHAEPAP